MDMRILRTLKVGILILAASCIYSFKGFTAGKGYSVFLDTFKNTSERTGIEIDVTRMVTDYFDSDARIKLVSEKDSEYLIYTTISGYRNEPYQYDPDGTVLSYRVVLLSYVSITEKSSGKKIREDKLITGWGSYSAAEREDEGLQRAANDLGMKILQEFISSVSQ